MHNNEETYQKNMEEAKLIMRLAEQEPAIYTSTTPAPPQPVTIDSLSAAIREVIEGPTSKDVTLLVTARLKIADLEMQLKTTTSDLERLHHWHTAQAEQLNRALSLLIGYANLPEGKELERLDAKLHIFMPEVYRNTGRRKKR